MNEGDICKHGCKDGWIRMDDGWVVDRWINGKMDGWMDGKMHGYAGL